jgi:hypothetical protein
MEIKNFIKAKVRGFLNENITRHPTLFDSVEKYLGDTFDAQNATAEITVGKRKSDWGDSSFREIIENAGDILRELSSRGTRPDFTYIEEKIKKVERWLNTPYFEKIPDDIKTLDDFNKTVLRWSNAVDDREFAVKFYSKILTQTINEYENIPVYSRETKLAKDLVLNLLYGNRNALIKNLSDMKNICEGIKHNGYITFTDL